MPHLAALAIAAPLVWFGADLVATGDPAFSFTYTQDRAVELHRVVGLGGLVEHGPRLLGQQLRPAVAIAAAAGIALLLYAGRCRFFLAWTLAAAAALAVTVVAGGPLNARNLLLVVALCCVASAAGVTAPARGDGPRHRALTVAGLAVAALLLATAPAQLQRLRDTRDTVVALRDRRDDARSSLDDAVACRPVTVPTPLMTPLLRIWEDVPLRSIRAAGLPARDGTYVSATRTALSGVGAAPPRRPPPRVPLGFALVRSVGGWTVSARCPRKTQ
jgi:hypothetical protein